ncbi:MAG: hypothetical protein LVQ96_01215 [Thermoplasmatales archaeon]|nr:hypothetical protein [Thermoplasmatales archaeon]MCW6169775.1 hypothetical protein [Thermoplasmatales archaeon]
MEPVKTGYSKNFLFSRKRITIISIIVIISVTGFFVGTHMETQNTVNVMWLSIHTQYTGSDHFFGPNVRYVQQDFHTLNSGTGETFSFSVTNYGHSTHEIAGALITTSGFHLIEVISGINTPIHPAQTVIIKLEVMTPPTDYAGNLNITLSTL